MCSLTPYFFAAGVAAAAGAAVEAVFFTFLWCFLGEALVVAEGLAAGFTAVAALLGAVVAGV
jgi:hypothetical protein